MSSNRLSCTYSSCSPYELSCPQPYADAHNQPCFASCGDSRAVVYPPPVTIVFPGPILSSCPQESIVGTTSPMDFGSSFGYGSSWGAQGSFGAGGCLGGRFSYPSSSFSSSSSSFSSSSYRRSPLAAVGGVGPVKPPKEAEASRDGSNASTRN
ncbi:feather keratin 4-like [Melanerpes formicivorus]|uniref:feather keratin 4-like n=1 Tax=Melanerpes formicivorus TaxID=211600 RepID=UPI00358EF9D1